RSAGDAEFDATGDGMTTGIVSRADSMVSQRWGVRHQTGHFCAQRKKICRVLMLSNPPIETATWYEAPPPGARCRFSASQVSTWERVRSQMTGSALVTVCPALIVAIWLLGDSWQSVERHQVSAPLVTTNCCVLVPT